MSKVFFDEVVDFIRSWYDTDQPIPLHAPVFHGNERKYVLETIDSTFVSSVGEYVTKFESMVADYTGATEAVATSNGTVALQIALLVSGVRHGEEVITQPLTFVATSNAIAHVGAIPIYVDCSLSTMGLSPDSLNEFLETNAINIKGESYNRKTGRRLAACIPMHTFGHVVEIENIRVICDRFNIPLIEDAAESLGSYCGDTHTGLIGDVGVLSFNGNKTITTGGGGMIITKNKQFALRAKHLTTTAKRPHQWEFFHDEVGYNFRLPNLNAALGCAQMERLPDLLRDKRELAYAYRDFFKDTKVRFFEEREGTTSNYWLNSIILSDRAERDEFLSFTNKKNIATRPIWTLMNKLPMYQKCQTTPLPNAEWFEDRVVNIPSSPRVKNV
ncbi:MAG TPA: LegC family aminotransferase [bacterium]|nr:LegC family aminotransferase [bacterium]HMY36423.1 LegC family aminotransferase [bacterium]HMZ03132.1 LegC family aminotransferase [bacterium]HNB08422.1 LegC family aminotransferase [bacterium]HNB56688.1 LegC family aminotransferase [bacterium]